jgi:hypothetical protein
LARSARSRFRKWEWLSTGNAKRQGCANEIDLQRAGRNLHEHRPGDHRMPRGPARDLWISPSTGKMAVLLLLLLLLLGSPEFAPPVLL